MVLCIQGPLVPWRPQLSCGRNFVLGAHWENDGGKEAKAAVLLVQRSTPGGWSVQAATATRLATRRPKWLL